MEVLDSAPELSLPPARRRRGTRVVAAALVVTAVGQGLALAEDRSLPAGVRLVVQDGGYTVATAPDPQLVSFQLDNPGPAVDLVGVRADVAGLTLLDVVASGSATGGREVGAGPDPLPPLRLGESVTLTLRFEVSDCEAVDAERHPLLLSLRDGRRRGEEKVVLRDYPDLSGLEGPDLRWQQVLAFASCPGAGGG